MLIRPQPEAYLQSRAIEVQIFTRKEALLLGWLMMQFLNSTAHGYVHRLDKERFEYIVLMRFEGTGMFFHVLLDLPGKRSSTESPKPKKHPPKTLLRLYERAGKRLNRRLVLDYISPDAMTQRWV